MPEILENEKIFEHYLQLPAEVRKMLIEEMTPEDKIRFTRCSKLSNREVKSSKNVCYGLEFEAYFEKNVKIGVRYDEFAFISYTLNFVEENEEKYLRYVDLDNEELWRTKLDSSTNLPMHAAERFKGLLQLYQNKIKKLDIHGSLFADKLKTFDFEIENLENLEKLQMNGNAENKLLLSKLRRPLEKLFVYTVENDRMLTDCEEIYQVHKVLLMPNTKFTREQLRRISAPTVRIKMGDLKELDIYHFIRSWQNKTIGKRVNRYFWQITNDPDWDMTVLFRNLEVEPEVDERGNFEIIIEQFEEPKTRAILKCSEDPDDDDDSINLLFDVIF